MILIVLGWLLASFQAWNFERPGECWWILLARWQVRPLQTARLLVQACVQGEVRQRPRHIAPSGYYYHISYESRKGDHRVPSHSQADSRATSYESPTFTVLPDPVRTAEPFDVFERVETNERKRTNRTCTTAKHRARRRKRTSSMSQRPGGVQRRAVLLPCDCSYP